VSKSKQVELAEQVAAKSLSVRETERLVQHAALPPKSAAKAVAGRADPDTRRLEEDLSEALATRVSVKARRGGRGSLVVDYASLEQLDGLVSRLKRR